MNVRWDGLSFELPALRDESVLTFVDDTGALSVTVTKEPLSGGRPALLKYVDAQLAAIKKAAQGYAVTSQTERTADSSPALHVTATVNALGARRVQHQLYVLCPHVVGERVVVIAVTADIAKEQAAAAALEQIASSFASDPLAPDHK